MNHTPDLRHVVWARYHVVCGIAFKVPPRCGWPLR